jgi:uncharacterized membrane-anchored protein
MGRGILRQLWLLLAIILLGNGAALAEALTPDQREAEIRSAWAAANKAAKYGPTTIQLVDQGSLPLRETQAFIPAAAANRLMKAMGNSAGDDRVGIIVSVEKGADWMVDVGWTGEGYVRDGDAKEWQADELLQNLKDGTEAQNEQRLSLGIPALDIIGWITPPTYEAATNRLVWSLAARDRGAPAAQPQTVNYNTYALGRNGFFSLNLLTDSVHVGADKAVAQQLLTDLRFADGKRYADFNSSTDKVAAFGLAALVGGVALKKVGLLAAIGLFLLKIWKIALIALLGGFAGLRSLLAGRKAKAEAATEAAAEAAAAAPPPGIDLRKPDPAPADAAAQPTDNPR